MDPISILGIAAAAVQFLDFGSRLLSTTIRTYKSATGQTETLVSLTTVANDLDLLAKRLSDKASKLSPQSQDASNPEAQDETLIRICDECSIIATEMRSILGTIQSKDATKFERLKKKILLASGSKVSTLKERLHNARQQIIMYALVSLWEGADIDGRRLGQIFQNQVDMMQVLSRIDNQTKDFGIHLTDLTSSIAGSRSNPPTRYELAATVRALSQAMESPSGQHKRDVTANDLVLESLHFERINDRERAIPAAFEQTFEWIFEDTPSSPDRQSSWSNFSAWLEEDSRDIYWITGKPGSGKSTLMKFIKHHQKLKTHLTVWAKGKPLLLATFYFWNPGSDMQKSYLGVLQSLLLQCLEQCPALAGEILPKIRLREMQIRVERDLYDFPHQAWTWEELVEMFVQLQSRTEDEFVIAFFIDGLDEFNGDPSDLVHFLKQISNRRGIKVCTSSRPWNVFNDSFERNPSLRLQDITGQDIVLYVHRSFDRQPGFLEQRALYPGEGLSLMNNIVTKAAGVFLWVSVVVRALTERIRDGDRLGNLQQTLNQLPEDLDQLFTAIHRTIKHQYISHSSRYFMFLELVYSKEQTLSAVKLLLADEDDDETLGKDLVNIDSPVLGGSGETLRFLMIRTARRRVNSRTMGLLEVTQDGYVEYLHRTVKEWVTRPETAAMISREIPEFFDPNMELLKAEIALLTTLKSEGSDSGWNLNEFWRAISLSLIRAGNVNSEYTTNKPRLKRMIHVLDDNASSIRRFCPYLCYQDDTHKTMPHWTWTQYDDGVAWKPPSYLINLTIRYLVPWHIDEVPDFLNNIPNRSLRRAEWISILHDAMLIPSPRRVTLPEASPIATEACRKQNLSAESRLKVIAFLLNIPQLDLDPDGVLFDLQTIQTHVSLYCRVDPSRPGQTRNFDGDLIDPISKEEQKYWYNVSQLLDGFSEALILKQAQAAVGCQGLLSSWVGSCLCFLQR